MKRLSDPVYRHVERELYEYHDTLQRIRELESEFLHSGGAVDTTAPYIQRGQIVKPAEVRATRLLTDKRYAYLRTVTDAIFKVYKDLPVDKKKLVYEKYWTKRGARSNAELAAMIPVDERTIIRWKKEIVSAVAHELGWE